MPVLEFAVLFYMFNQQRRLIQNSLIFGVLFFQSLTFAQVATWESSAISLFSENQAEVQEAQKSLEKTPSLNLQLKSALKDPTKSELAMKVISTMKLKSLTSDVIEAEKTDPSGKALLVLEELRDESTKIIIDRHLQQKKAVLGAAGKATEKVLVLEISSAEQLRLNRETRRKLLTDESHEVRMAYARNVVSEFLVQNQNPEVKEKWEELLRAKPYQVRLIALEGLKKITPLAGEYRNTLELCLQDPAVKVRDLCQQLRGER